MRGTRFDGGSGGHRQRGRAAPGRRRADALGRLRSACAGVIGLLLAASALAQDEQLTVSGPVPSVVPLGDSAEIRLTVSGASADPERPALPTIDGLGLQLLGPAQRMSTEVVGNRRFTQRSVSWTVVVTPRRLGKFEVPAFEWRTGSRRQTVGPFTVEAVADVRGEDLAFVDVAVEPLRVYVHEPIRIVVDYGVERSLRLVTNRANNGRSYYEIVLSAPWIDTMAGAVRLEQDAAGNSNRVNLVVDSGRGPYLAEVVYLDVAQREGRDFHHFRIDRAFLPTEPGTLELSAPILRFEQEVGPPRRDLFGGRIPGRVEQYFAYGEPVSVEVLPLPVEGRPADFTGAVGRFELRASADRRSVRVGDSVKLTLEVEGQGNLEFLGLPELGSVPGFHVLGRNENRDAESARVTYDLTPLDETAEALPAVTWSYFDTTPGVERYVTATTDPIPLEVLPLPESARLEALPGDGARPIVPGVDDIHDIVPADEILATEPVRAEEPRPLWLRLLAVAGPWSLVLAFLFARSRLRRARADVAGRRARGARRTFEQCLGREDAGAALTAYLAARLGVSEAAVIGPDLAERLVAAGLDATLARDLQAAVERGVAARYGGGVGLDAGEARTLVARAEAVPMRRSTAAQVLGLALLALPLGAQGPGDASALARAEAAYRAGDYATAAAAYAEAAEELGDRRLHYNAGNALYREGRYAEALVAWERARLALPRDERIAANIALAERRLEIGTDGGGEPFLDAVRALRDATAPTERFVACAVLHLLAAALLLLGGRALRVLGAGFAVLALLSTADLLLAGRRPPRAIVVGQEVPVVAEPRAALEPLMRVRRGVDVEVLARGREWTRVRVLDRDGWMPTETLGFVE